jgi:hypothetical protein
MIPIPYNPVLFAHDFISALDEAEQRSRSRPHFDEKAWFRCLAEAERRDNARALEGDPPSRVHPGFQLPNRRATWRCGFQEESDHLCANEIRVASNRWLTRFAPEFSSAAVDWRNVGKHPEVRR